MLRFLRRLLPWLTFALALLIIFILLVPTLVSTPMVVSRLEIAATKAVGRPVTLKQLRWSWLNGLSLSDLEIAEDSRFGDVPLLRLKKLRLSYDPVELFSRTLALEVDVSGLAGRMITDGQGRNNIDTLLAGLGGPEKKKSELEEKPDDRTKDVPLILPLDVRAHLLFDDISFQLIDEVQNRRVSLKDFSLHLDVPSLLREPLELDIQAPHLSCNEEMLEPISLNLSLAGLFRADNSLSSFNSKLQLNGHLPGVSIDLAGGPVQGLDGKVIVDVGDLLSSFNIFLPTDVPDVAGTLEFSFNGAYDVESGGAIDLNLLFTGSEMAVKAAPPAIPQVNTDFSVALAVSGRVEQLLNVDLDFNVIGLQASGAPLPEAAVGPLNIQVSQSVLLELAKDELRVDTARVQIGEKSYIDWRVAISALQTERIMQFDLDELHLDLGELMVLAAPLIPPGISLGTAEQSGVVELADFRFNGALSGGPAEVGLESLAVILPAVGVQQGEQDIAVKEIALHLEDFEVALNDFFPNDISLGLHVGVDDFSMEGAQEIYFENLALSDVSVRASDMAPAPLSPYGIRAKLVGGQDLTLTGLSLPGQLEVEKFSEKIRLETLLGEGGDTALTISELMVRAPSIIVDGLPGPRGDKKAQLTTSLAVDLHLDKLFMPEGNVQQTEVHGIGVELRMGEMLGVDFQGSLAELGTKEFLAELGGHINLGEVTVVAGSLLPPGLSAMGDIAFNCDTKGRVPMPDELQNLQNKELAPLQRFADLSFVDHLRFAVDLKEIGLDLPGSDNSQMVVRGGNTPQPLLFELRGADKGFDFSGRVEFPEIRQLPVSENMPEKLGLNLEFSGSTTDFNFFELHEKLQVDPFGVAQVFSLRFDNIDDLLSGKQPLGLGDVFKKLNVVMRNQVELAKEPGAPQPVTSTMGFGGKLAVDMGLKMRGGKDVSSNLSLQADELNISMGDKLELSGFDADFRFDKKFQIGTVAMETHPKSKAPLSLEVLAAALSETTLAPDTSSFAERFRRDIKQENPTFVLKSLRLMGDGPRIEVTDFAMNLKFVDSLPVIDNLQVNVMGGTILCSLALSEQEAQYGLGLKVDFSGIDAERMLPDLLAELPSSDTEMSGRLEVQTPLSPEPDKLLEELNVHVHISHIGQRMLSRILYSLDPYESNEAIIKQRKMVELGSPRWIQVDIENGNLSLRGEVTVTGVIIALPELKRVNIAGLPIEAELRKALASLTSLQNSLELLQADTLVLEVDGQVRPIRTR